MNLTGRRSWTQADGDPGLTVLTLNRAGRHVAGGADLIEDGPLPRSNRVLQSKKDLWNALGVNDARGLLVISDPEHRE